ncbi:MAG: DUF3179 domain-containing protein [Verrucomicrobia bacterium]|nr:DUF3179 domain-containing protein [Verrucomicrobiota bacterium]
MNITLLARTSVIAATIALVAIAPPRTNAESRSEMFNGFDLSSAIIPTNEIHAGGPPRDGIPAIDRPAFLRPSRVDYLRDEDPVISVTVDGKTRAYPLRILTRHEIVNDRIGGQFFAVTYCPLCGSAMVFNRTIAGQIRSFGVSGLLYQSDVLMYDRGSESLFSQLAMKAVAGPLSGTELEWLPSAQSTWTAWRARYPDGEVLSNRNGRNADYSHSPYAGYAWSPDTAFPVPVYRDELPKKAWVIGINLGGQSKAYSLTRLAQGATVSDTVGGVNVNVSYDTIAEEPVVLRETDGKVLPSVQAYWFAWQAFHPDTLVWAP